MGVKRFRQPINQWTLSEESDVIGVEETSDFRRRERHVRKVEIEKRRRHTTALRDSRMDVAGGGRGVAKVGASLTTSDVVR